MNSPSASPRSQIEASPPDSRLSIVAFATVWMARLILNTGHNMMYPFLPAFGRGLGITPESMRFLASLRLAAGFASPLFGPLADRLGRRTVMMSGVAFLGSSFVLISLLPRYGVALVAFVLLGLARAAYEPAVLAYISDRVPYDRRGRVIGIGELAFSISLLIGMPIVGLGIARLGWRSPFVVLAALSAFGLAAMLRLIPNDSGALVVERIGVGRLLRRLWRQPNVLGALGYVVLISMANENVFLVYGEWMENSFGLQVNTLGLVTAIIGVGVLCGEVFVSVGADRIGQRRVILMGVAATIVAYATIPFLSENLPATLGILFLMFIGHEIAAVGAISFVSELLPIARGTMLSLNFMAFLAGRTLGAILSSWLWNNGGFLVNGVASSLMSVVAGLLILATLAESRE